MGLNSGILVPPSKVTINGNTIDDLTVSNGLTYDAGNKSLQLGGPLTKNTFLSVGSSAKLGLGINPNSGAFSGYNLLINKPWIENNIFLRTGNVSASITVGTTSSLSFSSSTNLNVRTDARLRLIASSTIIGCYSQGYAGLSIKNPSTFTFIDANMIPFYASDAQGPGTGAFTCKTENGNTIILYPFNAYDAATGTATRTTFDTATVTTAQLAERVKALIDDLKQTGIIG